jgi:dihydropteroate synthase
MRLIDQFVWGKRSYVMGIVNVTPDSFSGDGLRVGSDWIERAVTRAGNFIGAGADILDIGGESTRPGSQAVSVDEEVARVCPVLEALAAAYPGTVLSVDTSKAAVAKAALGAGAAIINDVWALKADPDMPGLAAASGAPVVLMHNRSRPRDIDSDPKLGGRYLGAHYEHLIEDVSAELRALAENAVGAGVDPAQIILDPGIGFGKTVTQNLALINHLDRFKSLGYPLLVGPSRKSFIGHVLNLGPDEREEGTAATIAISVMRGADIVRAHDVATAVRVARMADAILRAPADGGGADRDRA